MIELTHARWVGLDLIKIKLNIGESDKNWWCKKKWCKLNMNQKVNFYNNNQEMVDIYQQKNDVSKKI